MQICTNGFNNLFGYTTKIIEKIHLVRRSLIFLLWLIIVTACSNERIMIVSYQMKDVKEIIPSYQLTIWLEKSDGTFAKTLFISEYLAYGGYLEYGICSSWTNKANWDNVTKEELDAVSDATPEPGDVRLELEFNLDELPDGEFQISI